MVNVITAAMELVETSAGVPYPAADPFGESLVALEDTGEEPDWQERALCAQTDPEAFFPEKGGSTREAKKVCLTCEVRDECLEYALMNDERFGSWGGPSARAQRNLKNRAVSGPPPGPHHPADDPRAVVRLPR